MQFSKKKSYLTLKLKVSGEKMKSVSRFVLLFAISIFVLNCPKPASSGGEGVLGLFFGGGSSTPANDTPPAKLVVLYNSSSQESGVTLDMGSEIINTSAGKSIVVTIKNVGTESLSLNGSPVISLEGADAGMFSVSQPSKTTLAKDESISSTIQFKPTSTGNKSAQVKIQSTDSAISTFLINLTGTGGPASPRIAIHTGNTTIAPSSSFSFGSQAAEIPGTPISFTVRNTGSLPAVLGVPVLETTSTDFQLSNVTAGTSLAVDGSFTFNLTFSPNTVGSKNAVITLNYEIAGNPTTFIFSVTGTATPKPVPTISISHNSSSYTSGGTLPTFGAIWPSVSSSAKTVTITNNGTATLTGLVVSEHSGDQNQFTTSALSTGASTLAAGSSATFDVTFAPTSTGAKSMVLRIVSTDGTNGSASSADITVQGTGKTGADVLVSWNTTNEKAVHVTDGGYKVCYSKTSGFSPSSVNGTTIFCDTVPNAGGTTPNSKVVTVNDFGTWYFKVFAFGKFNTAGGLPSSQSSVVVPST